MRKKNKFVQVISHKRLDPLTGLQTNKELRLAIHFSIRWAVSVCINEITFAMEKTQNGHS